MSFKVVKEMFLCLIIFMNLSQILEANHLKHAKCSLEDSACITAQAQSALKAFVDGIPELGIEKLDKMQIDPVIVERPNLKYEMRNIEIEGLKDAVFDDISIYMEFKIMRLAFHSNFVLRGVEKSDGSVFMVPVRGEGPLELALKNVQIEMVIPFDIVKDDQGNSFMDLKQYSYGLNAGGAHYDISNLYSGNAEKTEALNALFNQTWRTLVANLGPYFTSKMTDKMFAALKMYMRTYPL